MDFGTAISIQMTKGVAMDIRTKLKEQMLGPDAQAKSLALRLDNESRFYTDAHPLENTPLVSVVIPCRNGALFLGMTLQALADQTYTNFEVLINLDPRSTDDSQRIVEAFSAKDPRFKLMLDNKAPSQARNAGAAKAQGSFVMFCDADLAPTQNVLKEAVTRAAQHGYDLQVCPELSITYSFWGRCRSLEKIGYLEDHLQESSARFVRIAVHKAVAGFDENLWAGEDYDYFQRAKMLGYKGGRILATSWHHENWTLMGKAKKLFNYGVSFPPYFDRYPLLGAKQFAPVRYAYLTHWQLYVLHPFYTLGLIVSNGLFYTTCGIGMLKGYWKRWKES
jgi:glycosyltransferase involved in cell wall biosynthesis